MTTRLFAKLDVYRTDVPHSAAMNMAIDEALLERATVASIRLYRWQSPALSFGYFGRFADVSNYAVERNLVRRWTGGGIVLHGDDLTYSIVIPISDAAFDESSMSIYEKIHRALADALNGIGERSVLVGSARCADPRKRSGPDAVPINMCFATPVRADVLIDGHKVAGAAQRRTRRGLLQQGSIQRIEPGIGLAEGFAQSLSANCSHREIGDTILNRARELTQTKYGTDSWLRMR
jgi:lipoyl(octanoyl) transferase